MATVERIAVDVGDVLLAVLLMLSPLVLHDRPPTREPQVAQRRRGPAEVHALVDLGSGRPENSRSARTSDSFNDRLSGWSRGRTQAASGAPARHSCASTGVPASSVPALARSRR